MVSKMRYLYIWSNHVGRTCFGITSNPENRKRKYEGHNGFEVNWLRLYSGPANHIEDLEDRIKGEFWDHMFATGTGKYEWIQETVSTEQILNWLDWECENTYSNQIKEVENEHP
jgi:hypothetical protein